MPRNASEDSFGKRTYQWREESFHSVTTILGCLNKPWLVGWAKKFTAEYAVDNIEVLQAMLAPRALPTGEQVVDRQAAVDYLKGAAYRERDRAGDLGTAVHKAAEAYTLGRPMPAWPLPVQARLEFFQEFLAKYEPTYEMGMAEASVYNREQRYAGTLDGICVIDGKRLLIDYKTGKAVSNEVALQCAAYRHAEFIGGADGSEIPMLPVDGAVCLHLPPPGTKDYDWRLIELRADDDVFRAFQFVREAFRWQEQTSKKVLLGDYRRLGPQLALASEGT